MKLGLFADYSTFNNTLSQSDIDTYVAAVVAAVPNCTHICIAPYFDYPTQYSRWATSIHASGKKVWFRNAGYNFWQGKNGEMADTTTDALSTHRSQQQTFIATNSSIFQSGDVWSCVPDEPENWDGWDINYVSSATAEWKTAYNNFIQGCISDCTTAFASANVSGVDLTYVATNPTMSLSIINSTTADMLTAMNIDAYFDGTTGSSYPFYNQIDPHMEAATARYGVARYVNPSQGGKAYHYTSGVNKYVTLTEAQQADSLNDLLFALSKTITSFDGFTYFPTGRTTNPGSALFTYSAGIWTAKQAVTMLNRYFGILASGSVPKRKLIL